MSAKRLNSAILPSITGFDATALEIAQSEDGGSVRNDGNQVAFRRVVVGKRLIASDVQEHGSATPGE